MFTFSSVGVFEDPKVAGFSIATEAYEKHRTNFGNLQDLWGEDKLDVIDGREINDRMNSLVNFFRVAVLVLVHSRSVIDECWFGSVDADLECEMGGC
jgi:hypothetical protein